jgi:hypothetical protein
MPDTGSARAHRGRVLTTAGLIAVTAATLLMMGWAILPTSALADPTFEWGGQGFPNQTCTGTQATMLWIFNDNGSAVPTSLTINGQVQSGSWDQQGQGGAYHFTATISGTNYPPVSASVTYTGTLGSNSVLTLSHCDGTRTTTTTTTSTTTTGTTTTGTTTTGTTTTGTTTTGTTTTVPTTTVAPTTVTPTTVTPTTADSPSVAPTTISPRGTAFTGIEDVVPLGAIALTLLTSGTGLLWAGNRRRRDQEEE